MRVICPHEVTFHDRPTNMGEAQTFAQAVDQRRIQRDCAATVSGKLTQSPDAEVLLSPHVDAVVLLPKVGQ